MANSIRNWRKLRRMTLEQLAPRAGMTAGNLSRMERGEIPYTSVALDLLAKALDCRVVDLVAESQDIDLTLEIADELRRMSREERDTALRMLKAIRAA